MATNPNPESKVETKVYLRRATSKALRIERAVSGKSVSEILDELAWERFVDSGRDLPEPTAAVG